MCHHLIEGGLGYGVVLDVAGASVGRQDTEDAGQGGGPGGQLVLQQPPVALLQHDAREVMLHQALHRRWPGATHTHHHRVAIAKPAPGGEITTAAPPSAAGRPPPCCGSPGTAPSPLYLFLRCWMLPRQRKRPLTMIAILVQSASHSSMLPAWEV